MHFISIMKKSVAPKHFSHQNKLTLLIPFSHKPFEVPPYGSFYLELNTHATSLAKSRRPHLAKLRCKRKRDARSCYDSPSKCSSLHPPSVRGWVLPHIGAQATGVSQLYTDSCTDLKALRRLQTDEPARRSPRPGESSARGRLPLPP